MSLPPDDLLTVEDFLENDAFRAWVKERKPTDQLLWERWLALHPDRRIVYEEAVATWLVIQGKTEDPALVKSKTDELVKQLSGSTGVSRTLSGWRWQHWLSAAAVVCLIAWWQLNPQGPIGLFSTGKPKPDQAQPDKWKLVKNVSDLPLVVLLPDQSSVLLSPGSQLRFRPQMTHALREVYLQGEGFFEVTKNPARPFLVYTANLTTRVVGTSFGVRCFDRESTTRVQVKTGKVTVSPVASPEQTVVLIPNEEGSVTGRTEKVTKQKSNALTGKTSSIIAEPFMFEHTPVPDVFDRLEACYHLPIRYNRELLKHCTFTGQLNDVPFLEKIRLICLTVESTFDVANNQIVVHSQGCN